MTAAIVLALRVGLAIVLYYFLWRVLGSLWQDLKQQGNILSTRRKPGIQIETRTDDGTKNKHHFRQSEIVIGRGSHCNISLKDESLSKNHARVSFHHAQWWLEDLSSRNGTFLNEDQITTPTVVIDGDKFKCGNTTFTLHIDPYDDQFPKQPQFEDGDEE